MRVKCIDDSRFVNKHLCPKKGDVDEVLSIEPIPYWVGIKGDSYTLVRFGPDNHFGIDKFEIIDDPAEQLMREADELIAVTI